MDTILKLLFQNQFILNFLLILISILVLTILLIYLVAFFQGRSVSFWPPKIGSQTTIEKNSKAKTQSDDFIIDQPTYDNLIVSLKHTDIVSESDASTDL